MKARWASQPAFFGIVWKPATIFRISTPVVLLLLATGHPSICCHLLAATNIHLHFTLLLLLLLLPLLWRVVLAN